MESTFDYEKSPIYYYPKRRMSLSQREKNLPWLTEKVEEILDNHENESGIIHSGSYKISSEIFKTLSEKNRKRILVYNGTREKEEALVRFQSEKNLVLMGPSILEGLDLISEKSRFQVFGKVPFPSLGDRFVARKMQDQPEWYDWKAIISILQGVGRSVRSEEDWAVTYFLDGCLSDLLRRRRSFFPREFQSRIKVISEDI
jgi:Rad3-related DNA helicase